MKKIKQEFMENSKSIFNKILESTHDVFIIQDYITIDLAKTLMKNETIINNMIFLSDLRTNLWQNTGPVDLDILFNDCLQIAVLDILKPVYSMLKFHPPYFVEQWKKHLDNLESTHFAYDMVYGSIEYASKLVGKDLMTEHHKKSHYNYVAEHIMLQPWAPTASSEGRLVISREAIQQKKFHMYNANNWEDHYFVLKFSRMYSWLDVYSPLIAKIESVYGYDNCYDCYIELSIICQYLMRENKKYSSAQNISNFIPTTDQQLELVDGVNKIAHIINSHLRYDLKYNLNKSCGLHGSFLPCKENYLYFKCNNEWKIYKNGKIEPGENFHLHENFDKKDEIVLNQYLRKFVSNH
jgi:hypothetical protein